MSMNVSVLFKRFQYLVALTKPRITAMAVIMCMGGILLSHRSLTNLSLVVALLGCALAVASANALNMYLERDTDALMSRTSQRPLPAGNLMPPLALGFGLILGIVAFLLLYLVINPLTAFLALAAMFSYVCIYTPLKRKTSWALLVGAVPGAMPPLLGWTSAVGRIELTGLVLFGVLFLWQLPHFLAIAVYLKDQYKNAGIRVVPLLHGEKVAQIQASVYSLLLLPVSLLLVPLGAAGWFYFVAALILGVIYIVQSFKGLLKQDSASAVPWAKSLFVYSLFYLPILCLALWVDRLVGSWA